MTFAFALALNLVPKNRLFCKYSSVFCNFLIFVNTRVNIYFESLRLFLLSDMLISNFGKKILQIGLGVGVPAVTTFALLSRPLSAMVSLLYFLKIIFLNNTYLLIFNDSFDFQAASPSSIYDFTAKDIDGNDVSLSKYAGHVCIIVNVASK